MSNGGLNPKTVSFEWPTTCGELRDTAAVRYKEKATNRFTYFIQKVLINPR